MEVEDLTSSQSCSVEMCASPSVTVSIHAYVLLSISDYYSRCHVSKCKNTISAKEQSRSELVDDLIVGCILGVKSDERYEIVETIELPPINQLSDLQFPVQFYKKTKQMMDKAPSFKYDLLGWYCNYPLIKVNRNNVTANDDCQIEKQTSERASVFWKFHKKLMQVSGEEFPLFMLIDTNKLNCGDKAKKIQQESKKSYSSIVDSLPIEIFETRLCTFNGYILKHTGWEMDCELSEKIAIEYISNMAVNINSNASKISSYFDSHKETISILNKKTEIILAYITDIKEKNNKYDPRLVRDIAAFCSQLPKRFQNDFATMKPADKTNDLLLNEITKDCNDSKLLIHLGLLTKANILLERIMVRKSMKKYS